VATCLRRSAESFRFPGGVKSRRRHGALTVLPVERTRPAFRAAPDVRSPSFPRCPSAPLRPHPPPAERALRFLPSDARPLRPDTQSSPTRGSDSPRHNGTLWAPRQGLATAEYSWDACVCVRQRNGRAPSEGMARPEVKRIIPFDKSEIQFVVKGYPLPVDQIATERSFSPAHELRLPAALKSPPDPYLWLEKIELLSVRILSLWMKDDNFHVVARAQPDAIAIVQPSVIAIGFFGLLKMATGVSALRLPPHPQHRPTTPSCPPRLFA
jgi:hypothetical protein